MGLYKRNSVWWMSYIYKGRQIRQSTGTANRKLAEGILDKVKVKIIEGKYFDILEEASRTFAEMMDRYMKEYSARKSPSSHRRDEQSLKHLKPHFGNVVLAEISPKLIANYKARRYGEKAKPGTLKKELDLAKAAFNVAIGEWEWARDNPFRRVKMERINNERVRYLTDEEFEKVISHCPEWLKPIVLVARYTGIRRENIVQLRWSQVDILRKVILLDRTKNGDRLGMPLCGRLVDMLKSLAKVRHIRSEFVFTYPDGAPYSGNAVGMAFGRACKSAGISDFRFHDLRHTFASSLVQKGVDLYRVQRLLGHRDGRVTQRYAHLAPEDLREAVRLLDRGGSSYHKSITPKLCRKGANNASA